MRPILRYFGGKWKCASWIISHFPEHTVYVEPFGGAASVLLRKPRVKSEVYNDKYGEVYNLFFVLRDERMSRELCTAVELTPYSRNEFEQSWNMTDDRVERARRLIVRSIMGVGPDAASFRNTSFRNYATGNRSVADEWTRYPESLAAHVERMKGVIVENADYSYLFDKYDGYGTLFYLDPPYVMSERKSGGYALEMSDDEHAELIRRASTLRGRVVLSGYDNEMYQELLSGWDTIPHPGTSKECLWVK